MIRIEIVFTIFIFILTGCASPGYKPIPAQAINPTLKTPKDIGSDAFEIAKFHVFDDSTFKRLQTAIKSDTDDQTKTNTVREILCEGRKPKVKAPELFVTLVIPKGDPQDSVETISRHKKEFIKLTRIYLKQWLVMDANVPELMTQSINPDFSNFKENVIDTNYERRQANNRIALLIPFLPVQNSNEIIKHYSAMRITPALPAMQLEDHQWFPSRHFMAIADQKGHKIILSVKASNFAKVAYGHLNYGTESTSEILKEFQLKPDTFIQYITDNESRTIRNHSLYSVSQHAWKLENETTVRPLQMTVIEDIGWLRQNFAWRFPKETVEQLFKVELNADQRQFGLDHGKFSPDLAISHAQDMWNTIMLNQTSVSEAANDDGTVSFQVTLNFLEPYCQFSIPMNSLRGN